MEIDWDGDFWADHDEDCHGRIEDQKDEFPEGFNWSCCGSSGEEPGCAVGHHKSSSRIVRVKRQ